MKFASWKEMYDYVVAGNDLYSPSTHVYVFVYNDADALCFYSLDNEKVADILKKKESSNEEYWGAFLGTGGDILDDPAYDHYRYVEDEAQRALYLKPSFAFCEEWFSIEDWTETSKMSIENFRQAS